MATAAGAVANAGAVALTVIDATVYIQRGGNAITALTTGPPQRRIEAKTGEQFVVRAVQDQHVRTLRTLIRLKVDGPNPCRTGGESSRFQTVIQAESVNRAP